MYRVTVMKKYLWLPAKRDEMHNSRLRFYLDKRRVFEAELNTSPGTFDFYAPVNVERFRGKTLDIWGGAPPEWLHEIRQEDELPDVNDPARPRLHFTAEAGWLNDPNGLVYLDGTYHLYFQHNPYGVQWSDMHWGHAESRDLIHWAQRGPVLYPDETGTMFSGCALRDKRSTLHRGANCLLYFYTAAGGANEWSGERKFTQYLAYSEDKGRTITKTGRMVVGYIAGENRDPKVFYHQKSDAYIMVLYLEANDFAILRSKDLLDWKVSQTFSVEGMWECPDLFCLPVDGNREQMKWVFWSADGYYVIGRFDGHAFTPESERLAMYSNGLPYAAQTWSDTPGRRISVSWLRTGRRGKNYTGMMSIPVELSLLSTPEGIRMGCSFVEELADSRSSHITFNSLKELEAKPVEEENAPFELILRAPGGQSGKAVFTLAGEPFVIDFTAGVAGCGAQMLSFDPARPVGLRIVVDFGIVEATANRGMAYLAYEREANGLSGGVSVRIEGNLKINELSYYSLDDTE